MKRINQVIVIAGLLIAIMAFGAGCASYRINKNTGDVSTTGFFRNLAVTNEYYESGGLKKTDIKTESTTRDVMAGTNELIDTAVKTYSQIKP